MLTSAIKLAGFIIILSSGLILPVGANYPNFWTLIPLAGTFMFLVVKSENLITPWISHPIILRIGLASYSIYLIHQPLFAFYRLSKFETPTSFNYFVLIFASVVLGILSHKYLETPFRNQNSISYRKVLAVLTLMAMLILISGSQFVIKAGYFRGSKFFPVQTDLHRGLNAEFNMTPFQFKRDAFLEADAKHLIVFGNSQARDFINAFRTTSHIGKFEIVYRDDFNGCVDEFDNNSIIIKLIEQSDYLVFGSIPDEKCWNKFKREWPQKMSSVLVLGEKNFGMNVNAVMVNNVNQDNFFKVRNDVLERNLRAEKIFRENYVDMNAVIGSSKFSVPILDSSGFLISQDATHLTPKGAEFLGKKLEISNRFLFIK